MYLNLCSFFEGYLRLLAEELGKRCPVRWFQFSEEPKENEVKDEEAGARDDEGNGSMWQEFRKEGDEERGDE